VRYFFLSYAPDDDDLFVRRFYHDLSTDISRRIGQQAYADVGYLDDAGRMGSHWPADARAALANCQTFIALCSAKYLLTSRCGKSWEIFTERLRDYRRRNGQHSSALIPVIWAGDGVSDDAFAEEDLDITPHHTPDGEDLRVLMRLNSHRSAYRAFVSSLAHRVVETARTQRLPPAPPGTDIASAVNAFQARPGWRRGAARTQQVCFVVATGTREQMNTIRESVQFYGKQREDWAPFQPTVPQPLAAHARMVASGRLFDSEVVSIEAVPERLSASGADIVVLLVDAWATRLESVRTALREIDQRDDAEVAVLVPASRDDPETKAHQSELRTAVMGTFPGRTRRRDSTFRTDIETVGTFDDDLATALAEARHRIYRNRQVRQPASGRTAGRPILEGP
jgi:FxsC-like protein